METPLGTSAFVMRLSGLGFQRVNGTQRRRHLAGLNVVARAEVAEEDGG